jgi:hypothetical protein
MKERPIGSLSLAYVVLYKREAIREKPEAHENSLMAQPRKPKLGMHCKESKGIELPYSNHSRFPPTMQLVTDLVKDPETYPSIIKG